VHGSEREFLLGLALLLLLPMAVGLEAHELLVECLPTKAEAEEERR